MRPAPRVERCEARTVTAVRQPDHEGDEPVANRQDRGGRSRHKGHAKGLLYEGAFGVRALGESSPMTLDTVRSPGVTPQRDEPTPSWIFSDASL